MQNRIFGIETEYGLLIKADDPEVAPMIHRCVMEKKTFIATFSYDALLYADVVVVDIQCDYSKNALAEMALLR